MLIDGAETTPTFQPAMRIITDITNDNPAQVTTSFAHNYKTGTIVRLIIPYIYGMDAINNATGTITVTGATTFDIDIDTTNLDVFLVHPTFILDAFNTKPKVIPIGEVSTMIDAATQNVLT